MKIKTDFVTNSSSTSFIIGDLRNNKDGEIKVRISMEVDLSEFIHLTYSDVETFKKEFEEENGDGWVSEKEMNRMLEILKNHGNIHILTVTNEDGPVENLLLEQGLVEDNNMQFITEDIEVIKGEGGF